MFIGSPAQANALVKRCVLSPFLKVSTDCGALRWLGRVFHSRGAAEQNARSPMVQSLVLGILSVFGFEVQTFGVVSYVVSYGLLVWFSSCTRADKEALHRVVKVAGRIIGTSLPEISTVFNSRCLSRLKNIIKDQFHPAHHLFQLLPSGRRYRSIRSRTNRLTNSLYPQAVRLLNEP